MYSTDAAIKVHIEIIITDGLLRFILSHQYCVFSVVLDARQIQIFSFWDFLDIIFFFSQTLSIESASVERASRGPTGYEALRLKSALPPCCLISTGLSLVSPHVLQGGEAVTRESSACWGLLSCSGLAVSCLQKNWFVLLHGVPTPRSRNPPPPKLSRLHFFDSKSDHSAFLHWIVSTVVDKTDSCRWYGGHY